MDQGVIWSLKCIFRRMLLTFIVDGIDEMNQKHLMSNFDLLNAMHFIKCAWLEVHPDTTNNAFGKAKFLIGSSTDPTVSLSATAEEETYATIDDEILQNEIHEFNFDSDGVRIIHFRDCAIGMGGPNRKPYQTAEKKIMKGMTLQKYLS